MQNNPNGGGEGDHENGRLFSVPPSEKRYARTKMARVCSYSRFSLLDEVVQAKQSAAPAHTRVSTIKRWPTSEGTNLLTTIVVFYLKEKGYHAERINTTGIYRKNPRTGKMQWTPSGATKGSADIHSIIDGVFHAIEIKFGKDKQSPAQKEYEEEIKKNRGVYLIVKTFDDLIDYLEDIDAI